MFLEKTKIRKKTTNNKSIINIFNNKEKRKKLKKRKNLLSIKKITKFKIDKKQFIYYYIWLVIIIFLVIISVLFWPNFSVKNIEIIKKDNITNIDLSYRSIDDIRWESIFFINKKDIKDKLINYQKNIKNIDIEVVLPNTVKINIESYKALFNSEINWKKYIITENWTAIPTKEWNQEIWEINIKSIKNNNISLIDYKNIFDTKFISSIYILKKKLEENIINIEVNKITYYEIEREAHFYINNDTIIIFDLNWDINKQIQAISIFSKENEYNIDISKPWIVYIDLRINDKIFYCPIENESQCKKNLKDIYN